MLTAPTRLASDARHRAGPATTVLRVSACAVALDGTAMGASLPPITEGFGVLATAVGSSE